MLAQFLHFKKMFNQLKNSGHQRRPVLFFAYIIFGLHLFLYSVCFLYSIYRLDYSLLPTNILYRILAILLPVFLWIESTSNNDFNFHQRKTIAYYATIFNASLVLTSVTYELLSRLFLPGILAIHTDEIFTTGMVLLLARIVTQLPLLFILYLLLRALSRPIRDEKSRDVILSFKYEHLLTSKRNDNKISYSLNIAKDMHTGKPISVSEKDRFLHTLVDGTSGTGKTSSTILPAICNDLNMRCKAEKAQVEALSKLPDQESLKHNGNPTFSINDFSHTSEDVHAKINEISLSYPVCGITVLAPEDSLTDDVCALCEARGIPYNRIDATRNPDGTKKKGWMGMNPFFLSSSLSGDELQQAIVKKAVIFSDVMQVITDLKGKADSYFTGLNRQMLSNLAILVMNTVPIIHNRQATPEDLQMLINNFDLLPPYVSKLDELDRGHHRYTFILQYIREDLLGKGRAKMEDQSRGTRNIINEFLLMPGSKEVYCAQSSIDFDRILARGEITVCNYDLASGDSNAVAFGLFFLLSFNNAVLSRPGTESTRTPHFFFIDELPVLIHNSLEKNFSLFRKFRVAMFCAIQTLDQFEKNEITKYLKGVILGCAHIMVFGRSSLSDMEIFSAMAGMHEETEEQTSTTETALSMESPSFSYSTRELFTQKNTLEETDIRMKDFQEVTFFTTKNGRPVAPQHAKVSFLKKDDWNPKNIHAPSFEHLTGSISENNAPSAGVLTLNPNPGYRKAEITASYHLHSETNEYSETTFDSIGKTSQTDTIQEPTTPPESTLPEGSESLDGIF